MKNMRQQKILEIIQREDIETQNQLLDALAELGVVSTQATVSRDIKELCLVKELGPSGAYRYVVAADEGKDHYDRLRKIFRECVTSVVRAQNIVIIKTLPGLASAACSTIDKLDLENVAGTIAGDDTGLIVLLDNASAEKLCAYIQNAI